MTDVSRYKDKPLLRLAELYALWAIDQLPPRDRASLEELAPKLKDLFGGDGTWQSAVAAAAQFPIDMPLRIRQLWQVDVERAKINTAKLDPQSFVEAFVDTNAPI